MNNEILRENMQNQFSILARIELINNEQSIKNEDVFGPVENNGTLAIIVVQVHNRLHYLRQLIVSLSQVGRLNIITFTTVTFQEL